jgi:hypothetical protein
MNITKEMWDKMQKKVDQIPGLQLQVLKLTGKVNAMDARIYGRAKAEHLSEAQKRKVANYTDYKNKVAKWHDMAHGRHFTKEQIKNMKASVGSAYASRAAIKPNKRRGVIDNYGSMKTDSLKAVSYALGRTSNKGSSHGGSSTRGRTSSPSSQKSVTSRRR